MCTEADREELAALRAARTEILTGKMRSKARYGDKETAFVATDIAALNQRIAELEAICPSQSGEAGRARRHGFVRPGI